MKAAGRDADRVTGRRKEPILSDVSNVGSRLLLTQSGHGDPAVCGTTIAQRIIQTIAAMGEAFGLGRFCRVTGMLVT